ncbi:MAG: beta-N-acetylhexosaminidase [Clostridia bacterium]|nr:beta-N-acetylhexosaminidase [Clostridia bacterium]
MKLHFLNLNEELLSAVAELADIAGFALADDGLAVTVAEGEKPGLSIAYTEDGATITYGQRVELFRGIGRLLETAADKEAVAETPAYEDLCAMFDVARNAVLDIPVVKQLIRHMALMGFNSLQLYVEDCYEVDGYPYFGYMRGRYTKEEMKELAAYGDKFGVELTPCIQVLAHLNQLFRWSAHSKMLDWRDILLVDEPATYDLIEAMFKTLSECFTSRRVNIGMDEARMLGLGQYFKKHGYVEWSEILASHISKVMDICKKYGFAPMMWSDTLLSAAFVRNDYYAALRIEDPHLPQDVIDSVAEGMELVYWDYGNYYDDVSKMLKVHKEFREDNPIWFAGGASKWQGYCPLNEFSIDCSRSQLKACREHDIKKIMVTIWSGAAANLSILPTLQMYAEDCYTDNTADVWLAKRFATCCDGDYNDFMLLDRPNQVPGNPSPGGWWCTPSTFLMDQDIMVGLFEKHVVPGQLPPHFAKCAADLREATPRNPRWHYMFDMTYKLCHALELKCEAGVKLIAAYKAGDKAALRELVDTYLPEVAVRVEDFYQSYRNHWMAENKVFGLEIVDYHLAGLSARCRVAIQRVKDYLEGRVDSLPELEQERLYYDCKERETPDAIVEAVGWMASASPDSFVTI